MDDLYHGNVLKGKFDTALIHSWFQNRHSKGIALIDPVTHTYTHQNHTWKVPYGVRYALTVQLRYSQVTSRYPWYVTWRSPRTPSKRYKKYFSSLPQAILFVTTRAQYADKHATIVSRHGYEIPPALRGKLPRPWKWCPCCMTARKYYRVYPQQSFTTFLRLEGEREHKERTLPLMRCRVCGLTNRDGKFRRSNQAWHRTLIPAGKIRTPKQRPRRRTHA